MQRNSKERLQRVTDMSILLIVVMALYTYVKIIKLYT